MTVPTGPALAPVAKVAAAGVAGAAATVLVYVADLLGLELPAVVAAAIVAVLAFAAGYLRPTPTTTTPEPEPTAPTGDHADGTLTVAELTARTRAEDTTPPATA